MHALTQVGRLLYSSLHHSEYYHTSSRNRSKFFYLILRRFTLIRGKNVWQIMLCLYNINRQVLNVTCGPGRHRTATVDKRLVMELNRARGGLYRGGHC